MAYGTELVFELDDATLIRLANQNPEHQPADSDLPDDEARYDLIYAAGDVVKEQLAAVHSQLLRSRFGDIRRTGIRGGAGTDYLTVTTPEGDRTFGTFTISEFGDEDERQIAGISVWSRYVPTWADWRHPYGGSGAPIRFDTELHTMIEQARTAIATVIPEVENAPLACVFCHY